MNTLFNGKFATVTVLTISLLNVAAVFAQDYNTKANHESNTK